MAKSKQEWEDLGRNIEDIVNRAVNSRDYQKLDQTIRQVIDRAVDVSSEAVRKAVDNPSRGASRKTTYTKEKTEIPEAKKDLPVLYANPNGKTAVGIAKIVGGGVTTGLTMLLLLASVIVLVMEGTVFPAVAALAGMAGGMVLIGNGIQTLSRVGRFKTYCKTLGKKTYCSLEALARSAGKSVKFVRKELQKMIDEGLFLEGHLDKEQQNLITSHETYHHFEQSRLLLEERQRQETAERARQAQIQAQKQAEAARRDPRVQEVLDKGNAFIREIRRCNDAIPGVEISAKIDRMELIVRRIFDRAEEHPEVVPDLKKMMDYYLPMTVKLLNAYADMDAQPVQGENILASKQEIEATLDTLNLAFEKLLDELFEDTAMDVSSDITVLKTLLAQEGLTEDELTNLKKQKP